jgi:hypothetical protein
MKQHSPATGSRRRRHSLPLAAAAIAATTTLLAGTGAAFASPTTDAAGWVATQLTTSSPGSYLGGSGTPDVGLSVDGVIAFAAAGNTHESDVVDWLNDGDTDGNVVGYIGSSAQYPGGLAKLSVGAEIAGQDPTFFAGTDLLDALEQTQVSSGNFPDPRDTPTYFGYSNPTSQALAVLALTQGDPTYNAGTGKTLANAVTFLESQACTDGSFPWGNGYCGTTSPMGDVDTTAVAANALQYYGDYASDATAKSAASSAYTWLAGQQQVTGAWQSYCQPPNYDTLTDSVNSTGLAVATLNHGGGHATAVSNGQSWLQGAQSTVNHGQPACTNTGPSDVRATVQGVLGLSGLSYADLL